MRAQGRTKDERIALIAGTQHGLVTREQVLSTGLSADSLERRLQSRRLKKVGWRVYAVAGAPRTWNQSALAACLDHGPAAALSHYSAAAAWGLELEGDSKLHVTVPLAMSGQRRCEGVVIHRSRRLSDQERTVRAQLPVTSIARTILDLAGVAEPPDLATAVDTALTNRLVSPARLLDEVNEKTSRGRAGTRTLRELVLPWLDTPPDSVAECKLRRLIEVAGLTAPLAHYEVADGRNTKIHVDFAWPDQRVALELDGFRWHANPTAHARDARRSTWLASRGWFVLRVTPTEVDRNPGELLAALSQHLTRRADPALRTDR